MTDTLTTPATTPASTETAPTPAAPARRSRSRVRRLVVAMMMALGLLGTLSVTAPPANAASSVGACFTFANPPTHSKYAGYPVYLYYKATNGQWLQYQNRWGYTNSAGCATFYNTPTGVQLAIRAYTSTAYMTWDGWSSIAYPGSAGAQLGNFMVYRTR